MNRGNRVFVGIEPRKTSVDIMTLAFPNPSRSLDAARNAVRFTGYDGMLEIAFLIDVHALVTPTASDVTEPDCLRSFDALRPKIYAAAAKVYRHGRPTPYVLTAADIR